MALHPPHLAVHTLIGFMPCLTHSFTQRLEMASSRKGIPWNLAIPAYQRMSSQYPLRLVCVVDHCSVCFGFGCAGCSHWCFKKNKCLTAAGKTGSEIINLNSRLVCKGCESHVAQPGNDHLASTTRVPEHHLNGRPESLLGTR